MTLSVFNIQTRAERCLENTRDFLHEKTIKTKSGWGLDKFLDGENNPSNHIGVFGTSCGISTLISCGESIESSYIKHFKNWLITQKIEDGGWTLRKLQKKDTLTTATCYVIRALNDAGEEENSIFIKQALDWLITAQNPDYGWGLFQNDQISKTIATAQVLMTLARFRLYKDLENTFEGVKWLTSCHNTDYCWGLQPKSPSMIGVTALALLSLTSFHYPPYSPYIKNPVVSLLEKKISEFTTDTEVCSYPNNDKEEYYHLPSLSLSIRSLLIAGVDPRNEKIQQMIESLITLQDNGSWKDSTTGDRIPIWATMYACLALKEYLLQIENKRDFLQLNEEVMTIGTYLNTVQKVNLENQVALIDLTEKLESINLLLQNINNNNEIIINRFNNQKFQKLEQLIEKTFNKIKNSFHQKIVTIILEIATIIMIYVYIYSPTQLFVYIYGVIFTIIVAITTGLLIQKHNRK
jgi:hypothetical protein